MDILDLARQQKYVDKNEYYIFERTYLAGITYHIDEYLEYLNEEEKDLFAIFEPNNPYDKNAIAIYGGEHFIGYVPRDVAEDIAELPYEIKKDIVLDLRYRNERKCIYSILFPKKHYNAIQSIYYNLQSNYYLPKPTLKQKIIEWLGIESNTIFNIFLAIVSIALLFILFMICAVDS